MNKFIDLISGLFIGIVIAFAGVAILAIWEVLTDDVIYKSMVSVGILGFVLIMIMLAGKFMDKDEITTVALNPAFTPVRRVAIMTLSISVIFSAIVALLSVWEVVEEKYMTDVMATLAVVGVASVVVLVVALKRENNPFVKKTKISSGAAFWFILVLCIIVLISIF